LSDSSTIGVIVAVSAVGGLLLAICVYFVQRWMYRRRSRPSYAWKEDFAHAGMIGAIAFFGSVSRIIPWLFDEDPWQTLELIGRLSIILLLALAVHRLLLRALFRA
jgi:uncharacterized membrane-anchored protein